MASLSAASAAASSFLLRRRPAPFHPQQSLRPSPHAFRRLAGESSVFSNPSATASLRRQRWSWLSLASSSPVPEPPPPEDPIEGAKVVLSRIVDRVRIFFAVLFWMSLFFWGSAWDGRNDDSKKNKNPWGR